MNMEQPVVVLNLYIGILDATTLQSLTLSGAPVSKLPAYRPLVIARLPKLTSLGKRARMCICCMCTCALICLCACC